MPAIVDPSRRRLLGSGLGVSLLGYSSSWLQAAPKVDPDADWVPPDDFLRDLPRQMQALGVPGIGIAVVERGRLAWSRGFGVLQVGRDARVDDDTLFEMASLSKPVFAYAVMQLVQRGDMALDALLVDYVRPDYLGASAWIERISVRDVLRHTTGLPNWREHPDTEKLVPAVEPGQRIDYSGEAFTWLQLAVEAVTGESLDQAMVAEMLSLPSEAYLTEISEVADVDAIHAAREFARKHLADHLFEGLWLRYQANRELSKQTPYVAEAEHFARRALQNIALSYLMLSGKPEVLAATLDQFDTSDNMTERLTALAVLVNSPFEAEKAQALAVFAENFKDNPLVMDQWFSVQAGSTLPGGLARVKALMEHPAFTIKNPNKVRALVGAFAGQNLINFHAADGSGYRFLADLVIELNGFNPQIASRQLAPLTRWRKYDSARQALMKAELERIRSSGELSSDVFEVVSKSLA